ncbi:SET domain protein [Ancylostoma caninum]|uniref:SET domain protein n=1 Tax=Ancylostoma caninum TaxID=29170 RepID=A0A368GAP4_ANCCA|nr:SET domain protein [Ancylostoma caninum]
MNENAVDNMCKEAPDVVQLALRRTSQMSRAMLITQGRKVIHEDLSNGSERFPVRVVNDVDTAKMTDFVYTTRIVDRNGVLAARRNTVVTYSTPLYFSSAAVEEFARLVANVAVEFTMSTVVFTARRCAPGFARESSLEWPFVECSAACTCSLQCGNRVAQKGATYPIEVFRTCDGRGWAVRALRNIRKGAFIGEYTGELLCDAETARPERTDTYFFETRVGERLFTVDARLFGNFTRFINHSCKPNATVGMVVWEAQLEQLNHICIFATENIPKGKEITISYGQSWWDAKLPQFSCRCGHANCEYSEDRRKTELQRLAAEMAAELQARSASTVSSSSSDDSDEKRSV